MSKENKENNTEEKEAVQSKEAEKSSKESSEKDASAEKSSPEEGEKSEKTAENATDSDKIKTLQDQVEELTKANADLKDQLLRKAADFDNYRKRTIQEKQDAYDYANTSLLKDLLESLDNFDRTVEAASSATDPKTIADGVTMINKAMVSMLENKYNLVSYGAVGDAFDPDIHEAIGKSDDPVASPVLKAVYLKGYKLKDRVIRHAKVMVSMPDGSVKEEADSAKEENKASESEPEAENK
ncbi:MAG: nucleotide exchange factor GrpE [Treponema sp.]|nr:nucleotide exchange factor GrpE [Treponema sp.]